MKKKTTKTENRSRRKSVESRGKIDRINHDERTVQLSLPIAEIVAGVNDAVERVAGEDRPPGHEGAHRRGGRAARWQALRAPGGPASAAMGRSGESRGVLREEGSVQEATRAEHRWRGASSRTHGVLPERRSDATGGLSPGGPRRLDARLYEKAVDGVCDGYGIRKSSVSRHWKAISTKKLEELMERPLGDLDLVAILIDGVNFNDHVLAVSLGVSSDGSKHVLGLWQGATENTQIVKELLADMIRRGLDTDRQYLFVLDGAKALHKAVTSVFGENAVIQRCQVHKQRNVLSHLPKRYHFQIRSRLRIAWDMTSYPDAKEELEKLLDELKEINDSAARSLQEGFEETLTLHRLGIPPRLRRSLRSTNLIESCFSVTRKFFRNVKNWKNGNMVQRWGGTMLLEAEKRFRRVKGYRSMQSVVAAIRNPKVALVEKSA